MKKFTAILATTLISLSTFAQGHIISREVTLNVDGYERDGETATECKYQASLESPNSVKIRINSDNNAWIFFGFELPVNSLPLKEGYESYSKKSGERIHYANGVLTYQSKERDNWFVTHHEEISLVVSPDLKEIKEAAAVDYKKKFGKKAISKKMSCLF